MSKFRNQEKAAFWMADDDYGKTDLQPIPKPKALLKYTN